MNQYGILYDGKTKPRSAELSGTALVHAVKPLEQVRKMLFGNTGPVVGEDEPILVAVLLRTLDSYRRALTGISYRIVSQISENGIQQQLIAIDKSLRRYKNEELHLLVQAGAPHHS